jgi:hypothetical protein
MSSELLEEGLSLIQTPLNISIIEQAILSSFNVILTRPEWLSLILEMSIVKPGGLLPNATIIETILTTSCCMDVN